MPDDYYGLPFRRRMFTPDPEDNSGYPGVVVRDGTAYVAPKTTEQLMAEDYAESYERAKKMWENRIGTRFVPIASEDPNSGEASSYGAAPQNFTQFTPESIEKDVWGPFRERWGGHAGERFTTYKTAGGGIVGVEPRTGAVTTLLPDPEKAPPKEKEALFTIPTGFADGRPIGTTRVTKKQLLASFDKLSEDVKRSDAVRIALGADYPEPPHFVADAFRRRLAFGPPTPFTPVSTNRITFRKISD